MIILQKNKKLNQKNKFSNDKVFRMKIFIWNNKNSIRFEINIIGDWKKSH